LGIHALAEELQPDRFVMPIFLVDTAHFANAGILAGCPTVIELAVSAFYLPAREELVPGCRAFVFHHFRAVAFFPARLFVSPKIEL
jgi:hypothetical protein